MLGAGLFDYLARQPAEAAQFAASMQALTGAVAADAAKVIDVTGVSLAVDVGGGTGELVRELMRVNDGLHGHVLDLPEAAKAAIEAAGSADGLGTRFSAEAGDFGDGPGRRPAAQGRAARLGRHLVHAHPAQLPGGGPAGRAGDRDRERHPRPRPRPLRPCST